MITPAPTIAKEITNHPDYVDPLSIFDSQKYIKAAAKTGLLLLFKDVTDVSYLTSCVHLDYFKIIDRS